MSHGYQAVQSSHSLIDFVLSNPHISYEWNKHSSYLVSLAAKNEDHLLQLYQKLDSLGIEHQKFYEPDIGNQLTSIAFMSDVNLRKKFSNLPLLLKERKEVTSGN
jgi:hypothetical protein